MAANSSKKSFLIMITVGGIVIFGTIIISLIARGYQLNFKNGPILSPTGLISATSKPKSASVYINSRLFTATDDTINLPPGDYDIRIAKDGYLPWEKTIRVKNETVYQTDADLFRSVPDLRPISLSGAINPVVSPDNSKIIYAVATASASRDDGLYLYENNNNALPLIKNSPQQLSQNVSGIDWSKAQYQFSPNSQQVLATFKATNTHFLIDLNQPVNSKQFYDITAQLPIIFEEWDKQKNDLIATRLAHVPKELVPFVSTASAQDLLLSNSPGYDLVFYLATADGQLKTDIISPPPAQSTQKQERLIKKNNYYVYDIKDDTNFAIGTPAQLTNISWLPNANDLIFVQNNEINAIEYDGTNKQKLFGGTFDPTIVTSTTDGNQLLTLTSAYPGAPLNIYAITIK